MLEKFTSKVSDHFHVSKYYKITIQFFFKNSGGVIVKRACVLKPSSKFYYLTMVQHFAIKKLPICNDSFFTINLFYYWYFTTSCLENSICSTMASQGKDSLVINIRNNIENIKKDKDLALETILKIQIRDCIDKWCVDRL